MATTGDIVINVLADSTGLQNGLQDDIVVLKRWRQQVDSTLDSVGGGKGAQRLQELGRGLEDFSVGYQLQGLTGGFRAAGNNISQMASTISPLAGGIAGISVALAGVVPLMLNWGDASAKAAESQKKLAEELGRADKALNDRRDVLAAQQAGRAARQAQADMGAGPLQQEQARLQEQIRGIGQFERLIADEIAQTLKLNAVNPLDFNALKPGERPLTAMARQMALPPADANPFGRVPLAEQEVARVARLEDELAGLRRRRLTAEAQMPDAAALDAARGKEQFKALAEGDRARADEFARFNAEVMAAMQETGRGLADSMMTAREKFDWALIEAEGLFASGAIGADLKRRAEEQAVRDFAKASGYTGATPRLTGALRGSAADFESRLSSSKQTSDQLLEKQLNEARKTADHTAEMKRLAAEIARNTSQPAMVMDF